MQQLHLVGFTTDHDSLIFSGRKGAKSGGFVVPLDEQLLSMIAEAVRRRVADGEDLDLPPELLGPAAPPPRRQSQLSPREIQDRLRAGRSLEAIAAEAGVGEEWVARFAAPVDAERSQIVGRARELIYGKPRRGDSAEVLGLSVRWNLADRGVRLTNDEYDAGWSAYQVADHAWMVTFTFVSRKRTQVAEWEVDLATGELVSRNRLASDLGYVEPGRRRRSMASLQPVPMLGTKGARRPGAPTPTSARATEQGDETEERPSPRAAKRAAKKRAPARAGKAPAKVAKAPAAAKAKKGPAKAVRAAKAKKAPAKAAKPAKPAKAPGRATSKAAKPAKAAAKAAKAVAPPRRSTSAVKRAPRPRAKSAGAVRGARGREAPPAAPVAVAVIVERPEPNELGRRRMQLATGGAEVSRARPPVAAPPRRRQPAAVRIAASRPGQAPAPQDTGPPRPSPPQEPPAALVAPAAPPPAPVAPPSAAVDRAPALPESRADASRGREPSLDVGLDEETAEERRAERRRARAEARAAEARRQRTPRPPGEAELPPGDGRVVTIRANRATPPVSGEDTGEVVVPADRRPLRPAQPAAQPRRRRFTRASR